MTLLPDSTALLAEGADALTFLQAQLASDVRVLADGQWQWSCYLTPQGRVQSVFPLLRIGPERYVLVVPGGLADAVRERLARYRLRSKVELRAETDWQAQGEFGDCEAPAPGPGRWTMNLPGPRRLVVGTAPEGGIEVEMLSEWRRTDISHGIPVLSAAVSDTFTPHALSLGRLAAYSVKKGCYPGQEIVARTHFLGRSKRALARFGGDSDAVPAAATELVSDASGEPAGTVISAAAKAGRGFELLAVVREGLGDLRISSGSGDLLSPLPFAS